MSKPALAFTAIVLSLLIVVVLFAGLDDLPRNVRAEIAAEQKSLVDSRQQFQGVRRQLQRDLLSEPDLFRARSMDTVLPQRLDKAESTLQSAGQDLAALLALQKKNRRQDRDQAEQLLRHERSVRQVALTEATAVQAEADRWVELKRNLPKSLEQMERDYQAVRSADLAPVVTVVERAQTDWPAKKQDLDARLSALRAIPTEAETTWQSSAPLRRQAAAGEFATLDFPALIQAQDALRNDAAALPAKSDEVKAAASQLYVSWDKILEDLEFRRTDCREKIKIVRTRLTEVSSETQWLELPRSACEPVRNNLGMAIEHKPAGVFDSEAQRVAEPAGFAYIAPPSQGSNQYGRWEQRDGQSFWVWYGQYALLRDLFFHRDYRPLDTREYEGYRTAQQSGRTYYGRDESIGAPKYGTNGTITQKHYSDSRYAQSGGFRDSRYAQRGGGFSGSRYQSPAGRSRAQDSGRPGIFGSRRPADNHSFGRRPSSGFRPSFGGGRRFGRR